ncbi:MAG: hypothetical protein JNG88_14515 [Phycisphaerales bacterium]|nr:hypothetical protein [Phycisphaerales bacterium]
MAFMRRVVSPTLFVSAGVTITAGAAPGDNLIHHGWSGFGIYQAVGVLLGSACCIAGLVLRVAPAVVLGGIVVSAAAMADFLGLHGSPGFGLKQQALLILGASLFVVGIMRSMRRFRELAPRTQPEMAG